MRLHLGKVKVRTLAALDEFLGVVEKVERKVKDGSRHGLTVDQDMLFFHVPASGSMVRWAGRISDVVMPNAFSRAKIIYLTMRTAILPSLRSWYFLPLGAVYSMFSRTASRRLTWPLIMFPQVGELESMRMCDNIRACEINKMYKESMIITFKVGHKGTSARVQGIDDHLAVDGASDLDTAVLKTRSRRSGTPVGIVTDVSGFGQKVGQDATVEFLLAVDAALQKGLAGRIEDALEGGNELERFGREDLGLGSVHGTEDSDARDVGL